MSTQASPRFRLLLVDDDPVHLHAFSRVLGPMGFVTDTADSVAALEHKIMASRYDAILLDLCLGEDLGLESIPFVIKNSPHTRVIVLTGHGTVDTAVSALRLGATDFITKDKSPQEIGSLLRCMLDRQGTRAVSADDPLISQGLIGRSPALQQVLRTIDRLREVDSTVVIVGESGTGKELVARALHRTSRRKGEPFHAINCAAIPEQLLESELFGHVRGAFTDARADRKGIFEVCSEGTLLLDEIGEMPMSLQAKLLRVLQEREVTPVGASRSVRINTRVLASTNRQLEDEVREGRFRADLFFRLSVLRIEVPSLNERRDDIPMLVNHFIAHFNERFHKMVAPAEPDVMARLKAHDWPGNIRELRNAIERGVVLSDDNRLHLDDVLQPSRGERQRYRETMSPLMGAGEFALPLPEAKQHMEETYLRRVLTIARGNISEASRLSGLYRANLYRLMARYGINQADFKM